VDPQNRYRPLPSRRLALVDAFSTFQRVSPSYGASVFATTSHASMAQLPSHFNLRLVHAQYLEPYTEQQLQHALVHYQLSQVLTPEVDKALVARVRGLSGAIPKEVTKVAALL